jgi:hypothetical protein
VALAEFGRVPGAVPEVPKSSVQEQTQNRVPAAPQKPQLSTLPRSQEGGKLRHLLIPHLSGI